MNVSSNKNFCLCLCRLVESRPLLGVGDDVAINANDIKPPPMFVKKGAMVSTKYDVSFCLHTTKAFFQVKVILLLYRIKALWFGPSSGSNNIQKCRQREDE